MIAIDIGDSGAGMGGLSLAIALQKYAPDVDFRIYEGASQLSEIGAGISMHARTWKLMSALGLQGDLLEITGDGTHACRCSYFQCAVAS